MTLPTLERIVRRQPPAVAAIAPRAAEGTVDQQIAGSLGCSRSAVQARRAAAGVVSGREAARRARLERVRELHRVGLSDREIGQRTGGRAASAVAKDRRILKLTANYRGSRALVRAPRGGAAGRWAGRAPARTRGLYATTGDHP